MNAVSLPDCVFGYLATADAPCWGKTLHYAESTAGDVVNACEAHIDCSLTLDVSDDENRRRYIDRNKSNSA